MLQESPSHRQGPLQKAESMFIPIQLCTMSCIPFLTVFLFLEVSPASSSSGNFSQFTPDSATSPHSASSSPQPMTKSQKGKEDGMEGVRKAKSRTAFSKEQLQTLHQRFQSQKYLSPQQIRELAAVLGLTYKQVNVETLTHGIFVTQQLSGHITQ